MSSGEEGHAVMEADLDELHAPVRVYVTAAVAAIRARAPFRAHAPASRHESSGSGFWHKRPTRWKFPWATLRMLEWHERKVLNAAVRQGMWIARADGDYPIYVRGSLTGGVPACDSADRRFGHSRDCDDREDSRGGIGGMEPQHEARGVVCPVLVFHGAACKYVPILDNLMSMVPAGMTVVAPLFTPLWYYGSYTATSHLATVDAYWASLHAFLQGHGVFRIRIAGWSLGCLLANGFLRRYGSQCVAGPCTTFILALVFVKAIVCVNLSQSQSQNPTHHRGQSRALPLLLALPLPLPLVTAVNLHPERLSFQC